MSRQHGTYESLEKLASDEEKKKAKAEYDRLYRLKNKKLIQEKKRIYNESEAGRAMQKRQRQNNKKSGYHNAFCRKPEQRQKEKINRYKRLGLLGLKKHCIGCSKDKFVMEFQSMRVFPDGRNYLCNDCENYQQRELGVSTKGTIQLLVTTCNCRLSRYDFAKHPYLIESRKYLTTINKLLK